MIFQHGIWYVLLQGSNVHIRIFQEHFNLHLFTVSIVNFTTVKNLNSMSVISNEFTERTII